MKDGKGMNADHVNDNAHARVVASKMAELLMRMDNKGAIALRAGKKDAGWHTPDHTTWYDMNLEIYNGKQNTPSTMM